MRVLPRREEIEDRGAGAGLACVRDASPGWPLVVDLDGTLTHTDTLVESVIGLVKVSPLTLLLLPFWLLQGRAGFKEAVARRHGFSAAGLPYREDLLHYLREQRARGRRLVLATAAHRSIAEAVSAHLGLFDEVLATDARQNLKGDAKLRLVRQAFGDGFVYAGDSAADVPIWQAAKAAILVGTSAGVTRDMRAQVEIEKEFVNPKADWRVWLRALRVHQWTKNLLLFVPMLTAFAFDLHDGWLPLALAFAAFSMAASATYVFNDLWDLESDRRHPRKRFRPFASACIPLVRGAVAAVALLAAAFALAIGISLPFFALLALYVAATTAYSLVLKQYVLIDVIMLSLLYTLRMLAGAVVIGVPTTSWLLAFSGFLFFSLALVKRCSELVSLQNSGKPATSGRDYRTSDLIVLWPLGVGAALSSVVVFGLYISAPETQMRYGTPEFLWLVAIALTYWLARLWIKTARGEMDDDPIVYAMKDRGSRAVVLCMAGASLAGHFWS